MKSLESKNKNTLMKIYIGILPEFLKRWNTFDHAIPEALNFAEEAYDAFHEKFLKLPEKVPIKDIEEGWIDDLGKYHEGSPIGKYCKISQGAKDEGLYTSSQKKIGKIIGEDKYGTCYKVQWRGTKSFQIYHKSYIEIIPDEPNSNHGKVPRMKNPPPPPEPKIKKQRIRLEDDLVDDEDESDDLVERDKPEDDGHVYDGAPYD